MIKFYEKAGHALAVIGIIAVFGPLRVGMGWLSGWIISLFFNNMILGVLGKVGLHGVTLPELGATLAFLTSWLRTEVDVRKDN